MAEDERFKHIKDPDQRIRFSTTFAVKGKGGLETCPSCKKDRGWGITGPHDFFGTQVISLACINCGFISTHAIDYANQPEAPE